MKKTPSKPWPVSHMEDVLDLWGNGQWSALTRPPPSCWLTPGPRCYGIAGRTRNLFLADPWPAGGMWR